MTHAGRVKCIYIDPPYNTGNRDFVYNDRFGFAPAKGLVGKEARDTISKVETVMPGIEKTPTACGGDACIAESRVPVWSLEQARRLGFNDESLLVQYPTLTQADLDAAWGYAKAHRAEIEAAIRENEEA